ncbi:tripartite tricarboxylate transporter TctB family protein (plasmid) [Salipiger sp. H15]|uniref:Tripartite tricarboxylate transporter TctB family protein n=1 Tax=Alloyangia sp. H15 TaxID=3029062 RepID=A0AAU8AQV4_9RHOB
MIDRIVGTVVFMISVSAFWVARGYEAGFGDPLGPAVFPQMVAALAAILSLGLILRPDPNPAAQSRPALTRQIATVAVLAGYVLLLEPLGFPLSTTLGTACLALLFGARPLKAGITGLAVGLSLFVIFDRVLGLPLPFAPAILG